MPSLKELMEAKLKEKEESKEIVKEVKSPKKDETIKTPKLEEGTEKEDPKEGIDITSDALRTAQYLITGTSTRENIKDIFKGLEMFLKDHEIKEVGFREYQIVRKGKVHRGSKASLDGELGKLLRGTRK